MTNTQNKIPRKLTFRVFPDRDGTVYLSLYQVEGVKAKVSRPVSRKTLQEARDRLAAEIVTAQNVEQAGKEAKEKPAEMQKAQQEIDAVLHPMRAGSLLQRAKHLSGLILAALFQIFLGLAVISLAYMGVRYSSENFPWYLHLVVLAFYALILAGGILTVATERSRLRWLPKVREWFGPRGWLIYPILILVTSAAVFASITYDMVERGWVILEECRGFPVSEAKLLDFYMYHFLKLVPLLSINDVLNWPEPFCYSQSRVGFLILAFQGFVVIPIIATLRYCWKNREVIGGQTFEYVLSSAPQPGSEKKQD